VVATYTITDSSGDPGSQWRARGSWGDNSASDQKITPTALPDGSFEFLDSHTYTAAGTYIVIVIVNIAVPTSHKPNDNTVTTTIKVLRSIAVTPTDPSVPKGETEAFTATAILSDKTTENLTSQVTWASATPSVATITASGLAAGLSPGTTAARQARLVQLQEGQGHPLEIRNLQRCKRPGDADSEEAFCAQETGRALDLRWPA
jgi:hypothetical protein